MTQDASSCATHQPPFCRMASAAGTAVDKVTDVYDTPATALSVELIAEIQVNPREGAGSSVADKVEFYKENGLGAPKRVGYGTLVAGSNPARYRLRYSLSNHGLPGEVMTYFANCIARSAQDSTLKVPSYSRPVRVRRTG